MIGIAAFGGFWLVRNWRNAISPKGDVKPEDLRDGMPLRFTRNPAGRGAWQGWILRNGGSALSLSVEWEGDSAGQMPPKSPAVGEVLIVEVTGRHALYQFKATVRDSREDAERPAKCLIVIARPTEIRSYQRRRSPRSQVPVPATFELAECRSKLPQHGTIKDISVGGLRAEIGSMVTVSEASQLVATYKTGTLLRIRLPLPLIPGEGIFARVCSCERTAQRGGLGVRLACEFLPMPDFDPDLLVNHLFRTQGTAEH